MPRSYIGRTDDSDAVQCARALKAGQCRRRLALQKAAEYVCSRCLSAFLEPEARKAGIDVSTQEPLRTPVHHQQMRGNAVQQLDDVHVPEWMQHAKTVPSAELLGLFHVVRDCWMGECGPAFALVKAAGGSRRVDPAVDPVVHGAADLRIRSYPVRPLGQEASTA